MSTANPENNELLTLSQEFRNSPELQLYNSINRFKISIYTLNLNYKDLKDLIEFITTDSKSQKLDDIRYRDILDKVLDELIRKLHNFVASAFSLVDHTRVLYRKLYTKDTFPDYQARVENDFYNDPIIQFVDGLRQYCQHYKSPNISIQTSFKKGDPAPSKTIALLKEDLEEFDGWKSEAKKYLSNTASKIDLLNVITQYQEKVTKFQNWFDSRQREIHKDEFKILDQKNQQILLLQLQRFLNGALKGKEKSHTGEVDIFYGIFQSKDYDELNKIPMQSSKRCERALEILSQRIQVSEEIKDKIMQWYRIQT